MADQAFRLTVNGLQRFLRLPRTPAYAVSDNVGEDQVPATWFHATPGSAAWRRRDGALRGAVVVFRGELA